MAGSDFDLSAAINEAAHMLTNSESEKNPETTKYFLLTFISLCFFFFFMLGVIEKYHPRFGHETGMTVVLGIVISLIIYAIKGPEISASFRFSPNLFFNFFLPPIIFNSGFNMRKKKFFENLGNVGLFGIFTTIVCFVLYSMFGYYLLKMGL